MDKNTIDAMYCARVRSNLQIDAIVNEVTTTATTNQPASKQDNIHIICTK